MYSTCSVVYVLWPGLQDLHYVGNEHRERHGAAG